MPITPPKTRLFSCLEAIQPWLRHYPLQTPVLSDKFSSDHLLERLSSSQAADHAIERFCRRRIAISTWMDVERRQIVDKALGTIANCKTSIFTDGPATTLVEHLRPLVHRQQQQLAVRIQCNVRTVTVTNLTVHESRLPANRKKHHEVKLDGQTFYLRCKSEESREKFWIIGPWNPLTGEFTLYHFQQYLPLPTLDMLLKYRKWIVDADGTPMAPTATK